MDNAPNSDTIFWMDYPTHNFIMRFALPDGLDGEAAVNALGQAGLDDAVAGIGVPGMIALDFGRPAPELGLAMETALIDVVRALPGASLVAAGDTAA